MDRQKDIACADYFKDIFQKNNLWTMEVLWSFGSWDQEIDSWFTNHKPLIPTLAVFSKIKQNQKKPSAFEIGVTKIYCLKVIVTKI